MFECYWKCSSEIKKREKEIEDVGSRVQKAELVFDGGLKSLAIII